MHQPIETGKTIADTIITTAGVFRCCLASYDEMPTDKPVKIGDNFSCKYCKEKFTIVQEKNLIIWKPDWQI